MYDIRVVWWLGSTVVYLVGEGGMFIDYAYFSSIEKRLWSTHHSWTSSWNG